ncbi:MAG: flavin reductase [Lachnospiraceae bacterium]|nr:flavin reductase [Lachnospiraceae bacterium]MBQ2576386.1 flavin reductase [Lachnospiraceae bacterium]
MHTFQPLDINDTEFNPFKLIGNDWAALTTSVNGKTNAMTVSWGGVGVLWGKNIVSVYVRDSRYTKELLDEGSDFSLTFFDPSSHSKKSALKYLGAASGRSEDKIKTAGLNLHMEDDIPYIDEGIIVIKCRQMAHFSLNTEELPEEIREKWYSGNNEGNNHTVYIGEIVELLAR